MQVKYLRAQFDALPRQRIRRRRWIDEGGVWGKPGALAPRLDPPAGQGLNVSIRFVSWYYASACIQRHAADAS